MASEDELKQLGDTVSMLVGKLAAKAGPKPRPFPKKSLRRPDDWHHDANNLRFNGYWCWMSDRERKALDEARRQIAEERPYWRERFVEVIEHHLAHETDPAVIGDLKRELRKAQKALGVNRPTAETIRAQTRERVRRHRAKQRACVTLQK